MLTQKISNQTNFLESSKQLRHKMLQLKKKAREVFLLRYASNEDSYRTKIINDIIYNERTNIVAIFKDFLIYDDLSEFLKRYYKIQECYGRLPKFFDYYENCSRIFPNYIILHEAKYIYKNIQKKQKIIDIQQKMEMDIQEKGAFKEGIFKNSDDKIFDTEVYNSIMSQTTAKDEELQNFFNCGMNPATINNPNCLPENSIMSIEKLIDSIEDTEKNNVVVTKKEVKSVKTMMTVMSARNRVLANIPAKESSNNAIVQSQEENPAPHFEKKEIKTLEVSTSRQNSAHNLLTNIFTDKIDPFESREKRKDLKNKRAKEVNNSTSAATTIRDKLREEYKRELNIRISGNASPLRSSKIDEKARDIIIPKAKTSTVSHKSSSVPKLTNNIFYIINQNPQINTQITIYNNDSNQVSTLVNNSGIMGKKDDSKDIATKRIISSSKENRAVENIKAKMAFNVQENQISKDTKIFKPEVTNMINQAKDLKTISHPSTKKILSSRGIPPTNTKAIAQKIEDYRISTGYNANLQARTVSSLKERNPAATIQTEEMNRNIQNIIESKFTVTPIWKDKIISMRNNNMEKKENRQPSPLAMNSNDNTHILTSNKVVFESRASSAGKNIQNLVNKAKISNLLVTTHPKSSPSPKNRTIEQRSHIISAITNAISELKIGSSKRNRPKQSVPDLQLPDEDSSKRTIDSNKLHTISTTTTNKISPALKYFQISVSHDVFKQGSPTNQGTERNQVGIARKWKRK